MQLLGIAFILCSLHSLENLSVLLKDGFPSRIPIGEVTTSKKVYLSMIFKVDSCKCANHKAPEENICGRHKEEKSLSSML